jgi:haloalkane dehalogenase
MAAPGTRPAWLTDELFPCASRFLDIDGHSIHHVDEGCGPTLLMLHGNPTWSFVFRHLIARLRDRFRCVALDYPGFGLSVAAAGYDFLPASHLAVVEKLIDRLGLADLTPVMQDWGGPIGLGLAGRQPERVRALIIGNTWAWPVNDDPHFVRFSKAMGGALGGFAIRNFNAFVNLMIPLGTRRRRLSRPEMQAYRRPMSTRARREATHVFPREILGSARFLDEVRAGLDKLADKPALLCWGTKDIAFRDKERARFASMLPKAETVILPGAGHYVQEDAPDEIAAAIHSWWSTSVDRGR